MKAIRVHQPGGPEVLRLEEIAQPTPQAGEVLIKAAAAGVNYADVGQRQGMLGDPHAVELPYTPGFEVAGAIAQLGDGITNFAVGDRVMAVVDGGGYAEYALAPVAKVFPIPDGLDFAPATALLVQGLTAYGLIHDAARVQPGETVLVEAAAGGVGSLLIQLNKLAGAIVVGAASGSKLAYVKHLGADHAIDYTEREWSAQVFAATGGRGVDVVFDSVGGQIGGQAFGCLAPLGRMIVFGGASGQPLPLPQMMMPLNVKGLTISGFGGPWLRAGRAAVAAQALAAYVTQGQLTLEVGQAFTLEDAAAAHRALQERATTGKIVLRIAPES